MHIIRNTLLFVLRSLSLFESGLHHYIQDSHVKYTVRISLEFYKLAEDMFPASIKALNELLSDQFDSETFQPLNCDDIKSALELAKFCTFLCISIFTIEITFFFLRYLYLSHYRHETQKNKNFMARVMSYQVESIDLMLRKRH